MAFIRIHETDDAEAARLADAPEQSLNHELSKLPVTMHEWPGKQLLMLPRVNGQIHTIVVLPYRYHPGTEEAQRINRARPLGERRHEGSFDCIVVQSDHESYSVGGYDICVGIAELRRSRQVTTNFNYDQVFADK